MSKTINVAELAFEIVSLAGDARATYLEVLNDAKNERNISNEQKKQKLLQIKKQLREADDLIIECHQKQTLALQAEAANEKLEISFLMVHAQDHLMTAMLLKELAEHILTLYGFED